MSTTSTELTQEKKNEILLDRYMETVVNVRKAVLESMTPLEIAQMIVIHFDDSPEDVLDTANALVQEFVKDFQFTRTAAHEWADQAFNV